MDAFLGMGAGADDEGCQRWAVHTYALYRLHSLLRHGATTRADLGGAYLELARAATQAEGTGGD